MIKVSIADDHPLMLEGIKKVINNEMNIELLGEASDGNGVMTMLEKDLPDLLILDLSMPGKSGLDLIKDIKARYSEVPMLILSIHPEDRFAVRCLRAGASGYITKSSISDELVKAIHKITTEKRKYITPAVAEQLARQMDRKGEELHESLSDRELEVLCMIAEGKEISGIAEELSLSPHTIHTYRSRIKEKLDLNSNVEMTRYALHNGLIN